MATCDFLLASAIAADCSNPQVGGLESDAVIINRADVDFDSCVRDSANPSIVSTLALKSGKTGFAVTQMGNTPFTGSNHAFVAGTYRNKFNKVSAFLVPDHSPACSKNIIDQLANGDFVVVVKNKYAGSDSKAKYEILGYEAGLKATEMTRDPYSEDSDGGWLVTLTETGAPTSGVFLYDTDASTTAAAYNSLLS